MERNQFTFYSSFFEAISKIKKKADRVEAYDAICTYVFTGDEPDLGKMSESAAIAFLLVKPNLDVSKRRAESGRNGGKQNGSEPEANDKQNGSKTEANDKQNGSKTEANDKQNGSEKEKEKEKEDECPPSHVLPLTQKKQASDKQTFCAPTLDEVEEYAKLRGGLIDPKPFFDYYAAAEWIDGEGKPVRNWQQKFITWELRELERQKGRENGLARNDGRAQGEECLVPGVIRL